MGKLHVKLKLSRMIHSFQSCRSKHPSTLTSTPVPSFLRISPLKPFNSSIKRHVSSALTSIGCGSTSRSTQTTHHTRSPPPPTQPDHHFQWEKEEKFHVIAKTNLTPRREINEDGETIVKKVEKKSRRRKRRMVVRRKSTTSRCSENETPPRLSRFQRMIPCALEGKVRESFAVVKRSEDPYSDFKRSMVEMVMEKRMFKEEDLEQLLLCFLSLNSRDHHGVIVRAFSEVWDTLFVFDNAMSYR